MKRPCYITLTEIGSLCKAHEWSLPAVAIMDNFKGQVTKDVFTLLDSNSIYVALLPPNMTDKLQPLDVSANKLAKSFAKRKFEKWYAEEILKGRVLLTKILTCHYQ